MSDETGMLALVNQRREELLKELQQLEKRAEELKKEPTIENLAELDKINSRIDKVLTDLEKNEKDLKKETFREADSQEYKEFAEFIDDKIDDFEKGKENPGNSKGSPGENNIPPQDILKQIQEKYNCTLENTKGEIVADKYKQEYVSAKTGTESVDHTVPILIASAVIIKVIKDKIDAFRGSKGNEKDPQGKPEIDGQNGPEKDVAKQWEKEIDKKELDLKELQDRQLKTLDENKARQEIDINDAKKFPDNERRLETLEKLDKVIKDEEKNIENKFNKGMDEINKEKQALQNAVESTKHLEESKQQAEIERQRQAELERQRQLDGKKR